MKRIQWTALGVLLAAGPLSAQTPDRAIIVGISGGGADHLADLTTSSPAASIAPGFSLGANAGVQLTRNLAVHADFTFTKNGAWGATPFRGEDVNRFFFVAQVRYRYPLAIGLTPYGFAGLGTVSIDQLGQDTFRPTTKPAIMYGAGASYPIPNTPLQVFGEVKGFSYRWDMVGFDRTMIDVTFALGVSYRRAF